MLGLSPGTIKISILSKGGHSTFVLSTIDIHFNKLTLLLLSVLARLATPGPGCAGWG